MKHNRASELRAIAEGRMLLHVRNGVTVSRSMLAMIADEMDALRAAITPAEAGGLVERLNLPWPPDGSGDEVILPAWVIELMAEAATALEAQGVELTEAKRLTAELQREVFRINHSHFGERRLLVAERAAHAETKRMWEQACAMGAMQEDRLAELAAENERLKQKLADHQRDTSAVVSHETANVSDKPEGQQEPVAWRWKPKDSAAWIYDPKHEWLEAQSRDEIDAEPLFTRPSEQAVTEAGERAAEQVMTAHYERPLKAWELIALHEALKAAMEAGG